MNSQEIRAQFPNLQSLVKGNPLVYLDSAATTLKPMSVIDRIHKYYSFENSNVHRGAHWLSQQATQWFEESREEVARFIKAQSSDEIIFTKGTTEGFNLIADTLGQALLNAGDEVILSVLEHHANIVPWHGLKEKKSINVRFASLTPDGHIDFEDLKSLVSPSTKIISISACSNTLGSMSDLGPMIQWAKSKGIITVVDAAQWVTQEPIDVQALGCDFLVFSGHKIFGPTGIGVLYGRKEILDTLPPYQRGGAMIVEVNQEGSTYQRVPFRFEAGTPNIEGVLGLREAIRFFSQIDMQWLRTHEDSMLIKATEGLKAIDGIEIYGPEARSGKAPIISFNLSGVHYSDVASLLDQQGVAVRAGHHCTQPLMKYLNVKGTVRASFSIYNNQDDVDRFVKAVAKAKDILL